jgi:hypothetical protein
MISGLFALGGRGGLHDEFEFFGAITEFQVAPDVVPEPTSVILLGSGVIALAAASRRRQRTWLATAS